MRKEAVMKAIQKQISFNTMPIAIIFSLSLHGLLASFLIPPFPKFSEANIPSIEVVWEKKNTYSQENSHNQRKPKKLSTFKEKKSTSLLKTTSLIKKVNSNPPLPLDSSVQVNDKESGQSSSKATAKITSLRKTYHPLPDYPWICRKRGQEGKVSLKVKTNAEGQVREINLHKSSGYSRLDEVALNAVRTWIFAEGNLEKMLIISFRLRG